MEAQAIADIIEKMIDARIEQHSKTAHQGVSQGMGYVLNRNYMADRKAELAEALESLIKRQT